MFDERSYDDGISRDDDIRSRKATQARVRRNRRRGLEFEEEMFSLSSRYLMLFLTLNYKKRYREDITLGTIQQNRDRLFDYMESDEHPLLGEIHGLIWKLEEGPISGLHLHCLIFCSGKRRGDIVLARQVGEFWTDVITREWGDYRNSNAEKDQREYRWGVGIGQVNRHCDPRRDSLRLFIENYMAKANQVPRDRTEDDKLFGVRFFDRKRGP
jgi:hypothetical protein